MSKTSSKIKEVPEWLERIVAPQFAEEATGIRQRGKLGNFYSTGAGDDPPSLTDEQAQDLIEKGEGVAVPNAGAGSYREFFTRMKFTTIEVFDHTSSAGDWCFGVEENGVWRLAFQSNRYPYHGFIYSVRYDIVAPSFKALCGLSDQ